MSTDAKPKPPPTLTRLAADALVETIDGPVAVVKLVGKAMPVLTRFQDGALGFRMMREVREVEAEGSLIELANADGQVVRVGAEHVFVRPDGRTVRARELTPGDRLQAGWSYPSGYVPPDAEEYDAAIRARPFEAAVVIASARRVGPGQLFGGSVNQTRNFFLTFGACCRAQA